MEGTEREYHLFCGMMGPSKIVMSVSLRLEFQSRFLFYQIESKLNIYKSKKISSSPIAFISVHVLSFWS